MANRKVIAAREGVKLQPDKRSKAKVLPKFQSQIENPELQKFQEEIRSMLMELFKDSPFLNGRIVPANFSETPDPPLPALTVQLEHKLGRPAKGFLPMRVSKVKLDAGLYPSFIEVDPFGDTPDTETVLGDGVGKYGKRGDTHITILSDAPCSTLMWIW